jgi:hypothetical protein
MTQLHVNESRRKMVEEDEVCNVIVHTSYFQYTARNSFIFFGIAKMGVPFGYSAWCCGWCALLFKASVFYSKFS